MREQRAVLAALSSEPVREFLDIAERYCTTIETHGDYSELQFLQSLDTLLPLLYAKVHGLPDLDVPDKKQAVSIKDTTNQYFETSYPLRDKFGKHDVYREVYDPYSVEDAITATLSDDLSSIYVILKHGLVIYWEDHASAMARAIWDLKFGFTIEWGEHAAGALRAVHSLLHSHYDEDDELFDI